MQIRIKKEGVESGPFTKDEVSAMLADGRINKTDLAFSDGLSNWLPVLAVITPRATPPPFKEKIEPVKVKPDQFDTSRVKPNETVAKIVSQTKSLDWKLVIPFKCIVEDKPWNLRWVRWVLWFACTFFLINYFLSTNDISTDQASFLLILNWALVQAFGLSFIIKPDIFQKDRAIFLIIPAMLLSVILFVIAGKITFVNSLYQATASVDFIKRTGAILVTVLIHQVIFASPFVFIYLKQEKADTIKTIMFYGLLAGLSLSMTPDLTSLMQHKWNNLNGLSLGIFEGRSFFVQITFSVLSGIWGALTGYLIASGVRNKQTAFGWILAAILVPTGLFTIFLATNSSIVGLLVIILSVFLFSNYLKSQIEP